MGRIIVIEDNPVFRDHVCGMLEKAGYKTRTAYDCAGARRLLEELDDGDIIVSDLRLPDGECTEVLEPEVVCSRAVLDLKKYDQEHKTDYYLTLKTYITGQLHEAGSRGLYPQDPAAGKAASKDK